MKVEHFEPRSAKPDLILQWSNLLGCCSGIYADGNATITHCDSHRTPYAHNPPSAPTGLLNTHPVTSPDEPASLFRVQVRGKELGRLRPATAEAKHDLDELNLNAKFLIENRRREVEKLRNDLSKLKGQASLSFLERRYKAATVATADGLPQYAHVVAEYLKSKLRRHERQ